MAVFIVQWNAGAYQHLMSASDLFGDEGTTAFFRSVHNDVSFRHLIDAAGLM